MSKIENKQTWAIKTAVRLRTVLASYSDISPGDRGGYLVDEVEHALEDALEGDIPMHGEDRRSLLDALEEYFPVYGEEPEEGRGADSRLTAGGDFSTGAMVDELCDRAGELTEAQLTKLLAAAASAGRHPGSTVPKPVTDEISFPANSAGMDDFSKSMDLLKQEMGITGELESELQLNRLLEMLGILTDGFRDIYRFVWPYWSNMSKMAPREIRAQAAPAYPDGLENAIHSFLTGGGAGGDEFHQEIDKTKKILISILYGLRKGANDYGQRHEKKLSPDSIQDTVMQEEGVSDARRVRDPERKCWEKYSKLTKHQTADAIHDEIVTTMAEAASNHLKLS